MIFIVCLNYVFYENTLSDKYDLEIGIKNIIYKQFL